MQNQIAIFSLKINAKQTINIETLSAIGSSILPYSLSLFNFLAKNPSKKSVNPAKIIMNNDKIKKSSKIKKNTTTARTILR